MYKLHTPRLRALLLLPIERTLAYGSGPPSGHFLTPSEPTSTPRPPHYSARDTERTTCPCISNFSSLFREALPPSWLLESLACLASITPLLHWHGASSHHIRSGAQGSGSKRGIRKL